MKRTQYGITLVALVITIIILLILAGISISALTGNGLFEKAQEAKEKSEMESVKEEINLILSEWQIEKTVGKKTIEDFLDEKIVKKQIDSKNIKEDNTIEVEKNGYSILIDRDNSKIINISKNTEDIIFNNESIISKVSKINISGVQEITVKGKIEDGTEEQVNYSINAIVHNGDLILDGQTAVEGATLSDNIYEFGNAETDVATSTEDAKNMVVLKVNGDLTINDGVTLTACKSTSGYGGPKGMMIYCTGTITNNGTISMTARGARAEGQNVYLWRNNDGSYEYVPAVGAVGGMSKTGVDPFLGTIGTNGTGRQTRRWFRWWSERFEV